MPATNTRKTHTSFEKEQHASIAGVRLQNGRPQLACSCSNYCSYAVNYLYSARFGLLRIKASHAGDECLTGILLWDLFRGATVELKAGLGLRYGVEW